MTSLELIATGRLYGHRDGFASLNEAITAMSGFTAGEARGAVGIFELDGRFHCRVVNAAAMTPIDPATDPHGFPLETDSTVFGSIAPTFGTPLRAIVDGARIIYAAR